jgi:hypothetical protein
VLIQVYRAEESEWKAYLNTLPKSFPFHSGLIANWDKLVNYLPLDFKGILIILCCTDLF